MHSFFEKVLGGSSVFNLMMYTRGNHDDYDEWKWNGNKGWGYNDILPYFKKLESFHGHNKEEATILEKIEKFLATMTGGATVQDKMDVQYHGRDGPLSVSNFPIDPLTYGFREAFFKAVKSKNLPLNADVSGKSQIGFTNLPGMIDTLGYRDHVVKAYLQDIPSNLKICKNALVMNFNLPEPKTKKVQSVRFKYSGKFFNISAKKEYILSAGGLGSPQILERSGIGIPDILQKAGVSVKHVLPGVGENLQDHFLNPSTAFAIKLNTESSPNPLTIGLTSLTGFLNLTDYSKSIPDVQYFLTFPHRSLAGPVDPEIDKQFKSVYQRNKTILIVSGALLRQQNPGSVHITQATDPNLTPLIKPNIYTGERDIELAIKAARLARTIMRSPALKPFQPEVLIIKPCQKYKPDSVEEIICGAKQFSTLLYHTVGTAAMGPDDKVHVVNDELKVHGISNLRVIDSSIMPFVVRSNIEIPTIMIGEKGADLIKNEWKGPDYFKLFKSRGQ